MSTLHPGRTAAVLWILVAPATAWAQAPAAPAAEPNSGLTWGIAVGLAVVVLLTGFLNPKRSHLT